MTDNTLDYGKLLSDFMGLTGANEEEAFNWLEMTNYKLQTSIDLYFSSHQSSSSHFPAIQENNKNLLDEDYVRQPDAVKRQRLVNDVAFIGYFTQINFDLHDNRNKGGKANSFSLQFRCWFQTIE